MQEGASDQCILLAVGFVVAAELRRALLDAVEVLMQIQTLVLRFEHAAGNVGAVVCHTLEVCEQVRPDEAGFQTDADSLSFSFQGGNQAGQESNSELRSFIGNIFEHEAQEEIAGNDNLQNWTPAQGLNIRV